MSDTLYEKIVARMRTDDKHRIELGQMAKDINEAMKPANSTGNLIQTYSRIRRRWCEISGEPLVSPTVAKTASRLWKMLGGAS